MMLRKSSGEERFGCLFGLLGALVGPLIGLNVCQSAAARAEPLRSIDPDIAVCGLFVVGPMLGGAIIGGLAGSVVGMALWRLIRWCCRKPTQS